MVAREVVFGWMGLGGLLGGWVQIEALACFCCSFGCRLVVAESTSHRFIRHFASCLSLLSQGWLRFPFSPGGPIVNHDRVMFVLESNGYVSQHRGLQTFLPDHVL